MSNITVADYMEHKLSYNCQIVNFMQYSLSFAETGHTLNKLQNGLRKLK